MGSTTSQEEIDEYTFGVYQNALKDKGLIPDVGVDESLLKYSGLDSNSVLQTYSNELVHSVPGFTESLGSSLSSFKSVPNAVGLGALVLSIIMEIIIKSTSQRSDDSYSMIRRVFGEEKASSVRDTVQEYVKRHQMFINNEQRLREELQRLEQQLSGHLTTLRNSLLLDGQMSTRGFKIWVNGAFFHLQMMVHEARLSTETDQASRYVNSINVAIDLYLKDLDDLLKKYKTYKISITTIYSYCDYSYPYSHVYKYLKNTESGYIHYGDDLIGFLLSNSASSLIESFVNHIFSKYEPITGLKNQFLNIKNNLNSLINQHDAFTLPSRA